MNPMPEQQDREESDCLIALERFQDRDDLIISQEELMKRLFFEDSRNDRIISWKIDWEINSMPSPLWVIHPAGVSGLSIIHLSGKE